MEHLFRERMEYITASKSLGCFICNAVALPEADEENLVISRDPGAIAILNRYPYNSGHLLVAPLQHVGELEDLSPPELGEVMTLVQRSVQAMKVAFEPEGFNIGLNLGAVAGAGLPGHLHVHVVPRWAGDTNFMPVTGGTKVLPELLESTFMRLKQTLAAD